MCRPDHFAVTYRINPWMDPGRPVDVDLAVRQWEALVATYRGLGHRVELIDAVPGLPDMVFAANGAFVLDGTAYGARFLVEERTGEEAPYRRWLAAQGFEVVVPACTNEGAGDLLAAGDVVLGGHGFRTSLEAHREVAERMGREVVSLELVDPRYYHLDTALTVLDDASVAWFPDAFSPAARAAVEARFPDALVASAADAEVLGLNAVSDGRHVVLPSAAEGLVAQLRARGYEPIGVDVSELLKAGGGPRCCTLELR